MKKSELILKKKTTNLYITFDLMFIKKYIIVFIAKPPYNTTEFLQFNWFNFLL